ncbi:MAG: SCP2 sterol-binding domain-containing protein [Bacteroides sp.]|nr:SCP2 sterol-binding domain-containing protein [Eubacterium sp.]MCM1417753.1 SCP2 sterol-binding domain-containing protein [Roseburia sp.]MCM1461356.1 SCP2 sterol-binding domain-containing protein [Bacteroides sp.]
MTFNELLEKIRERAAAIDPAGVGFLAVQVNITDKDEGGVFYVEIKDGAINIEPYDYHDRSCDFTVSQNNFLRIMEGKLDPVVAFSTGRLKVDGDLGKALEFSKLLKAK